MVGPGEGLSSSTAGWVYGEPGKTVETCTSVGKHLHLEVLRVDRGLGFHGSLGNHQYGLSRIGNGGEKTES